MPAVPAAPEPLPGSTKPGAKLDFGEKAVITVGRAENPARVGVIVTRIDKAPAEDAAALRAQFGDQMAWPYFIRVELINIDGNIGSGYSGPLISQNEGGGGGLQYLNQDLILPHCTVHSSPPAGWNKGGRFESCRIAFADPDRVYMDVDGGSVSWG